MAKVDIKKLSGTEFQVSGEFSFDEVKSVYDEELERIRREVKIPGFRPGKAPLDLVEARYGEEVRSSTVRRKIADIIDEETKKKEKWLAVVGIQDLVWNEKNGGTVNFSVKVEVIPRKKINLDVKLDKKKGDDVDVSEDEIKREIELVRERYAVLENSEKEQISEEDIGVFDIVVKDIKTGRVVSREKERILDMGRVEDWFKKIALGMRRGETKEAVVYLNGDRKVRVTLREIKRKSLPSDDDLAKTLGFKNFDELKEDIRKRIKEGKERALKEQKYVELITKLAEKNKVEIPRNLIAEKFEELRRRNPGMSEQDAQNFALFQAVETVLLLNVAEDENIKVSDEDIENYINKMASELRVSPDRVRKAVENARDNIEESIRREKAKEKIMSIIKV